MTEQLKKLAKLNQLARALRKAGSPAQSRDALQFNELVNDATMNLGTAIILHYKAGYKPFRGYPMERPGDQPEVITGTGMPLPALTDREAYSNAQANSREGYDLTCKNCGKTFSFSDFDLFQNETCPECDSILERV